MPISLDELKKLNDMFLTKTPEHIKVLLAKKSQTEIDELKRYVEGKLAGIKGNLPLTAKYNSVYGVLKGLYAPQINMGRRPAVKTNARPLMGPGEYVAREKARSGQRGS